MHILLLLVGGNHDLRVYFLPHFLSASLAGCLLVPPFIPLLSGHLHISQVSHSCTLAWKEDGGAWWAAVHGSLRVGHD